MDIASGCMEVDGMDTAFLRFRSLSLWAYRCLFVALLGYAATFYASTHVPVYGGTPISGQRELIMLWLPLGLLGAVLVGPIRTRLEQIIREVAAANHWTVIEWRFSPIMSTCSFARTQTRLAGPAWLHHDW